MTRRESLLLGLSAAAASINAAPRTPPYARTLPNFLEKLALEAYNRRNLALSKITTPQQAVERQKWATETLWKLIGGTPARTDIRIPKEVQTVPATGFHIEKFSFPSRPGTIIPVNLYVPDQAKFKPPYPGVLFQMGHSLNGKAAEPYQKCCQGLAQLGYLVLAFDPMGQGERTYLHVGDADEEHSRPGRQMLLTGDTATRYQLWDAFRALDVLAEHPLVDRNRLATTGQSGGGTLSMLLAAVDPRLSCAAISSGNTENYACKNYRAPGSTDDAEQNIIGGAELGFDRWDWLYPIAPKPLLVLASARDEFGTYSPRYIESGEEEFAKLKRFYKILGAPDANLQWKTTQLPHALSHPMRVEIYRFFEVHLKGAKPNPTLEEPPVKPLPDQSLEVGIPKPTRIAMQAPTPKPISPVALRTKLGGIVATPAKPPIVIARERGERCTIETLDIPSEPGVLLPAYHFRPLGKDPGRTILLLHPAGRTRTWREGELCQNIAASGKANVLAFDVRGIGELTPEAAPGHANYSRNHTNDESYAWASLMLNRPLLSQRITDILAVILAFPSTKLTMAAYGSMCVPALCATALEPRIETLQLTRGLISWASLLTTDDYKEPFSNFAPGILLETDLPHIATTMKTRLILASPVNGAGDPVPEDAVRRAYRPETIVSSNARWDEQAMDALTQ
ncbi:xylan esterase [Bryobacterales bacterium F-183]|nr:xylan esterase [Bryobacterales bacterium F-183]